MLLISNLFASLLLSLTVVRPTLSLTCFENDEEGIVYEITNESWTYCALTPAMGGAMGSLFGIDSEVEQLDHYNTAFGVNDGQYQILSLCVFEKYDLSKMAISPRFKALVAEFHFRCVCNYDRCNSATNFAAYLKGIRTDNA